jgi:hypothetical protein
MTDELAKAQLGNVGDLIARTRFWGLLGMRAANDSRLTVLGYALSVFCQYAWRSTTPIRRTFSSQRTRARSSVSPNARQIVNCHTIKRLELHSKTDCAP